MANVIQNKNTPSSTVRVISTRDNTADASASAATTANKTNAVASSAEIDLDDKALYLNRELTWLAFNSRVLSMAA
ncbi:MAG: hypothetical protein GQ549_07510, partial [Gammaproteobacteria bacterium]|nr:hypothetical protein [Gammaproteobacteria bacterium]